MNHLIEKAPSVVEIGGVSHYIETDYAVCLQTVLALQNSDLTHAERMDILLYNLYGGAPHDPQEAVRVALWFLRCGDEKEGPVIAEKLCDFAHDSGPINSAMLKKGVDLNKADGLHWWTFMAHFAEIPESAFTRIVYLRSRKNKGKLSKDEREECARIGWDVIDLPDPELEELTQ